MMTFRILMTIQLCLLVVLGTIPGQGVASDDLQLEELMEGFEGEAEDPQRDPQTDDPQGGATSSITPESADNKVELDGYINLFTSYNFEHEAPAEGETDWRGFSSGRLQAALELKVDVSDRWRSLISIKGQYDTIYGWRGHDRFTDEVNQTYEHELELAETYLLGRLSERFDLKVGRQIVVWGKSDNIRITDVINPLNLREPGITDIEDLRLPVTMTKLDYYINRWNLSALVIHETRYNKNPQYGSDFYPGDTASPLVEDPEEGFGETQYAMAINGIFSGWDVAFYYANVLKDASHIETTTVGEASESVLSHERLDMFGVACNIAYGNWLIKSEAAHFFGLQYHATDAEKFTRTDILVGFEYSGIDNTTISIEWANRHIHGFVDTLKESPDEALEDDTQTVIRMSRQFHNDTLECTLLAYFYGNAWQEGAVQRLTADYDINDDLAVIVGVIFYQAGERYTTRNIGENDRVYLQIQYHF